MKTETNSLRRLIARLGGRAAFAVGVVTAALALSGGVASAATNTVTIPEQGGNNKTELNPGALMYAGYDFEYIAGATTTFVNAQAVLSVKCKVGSVTPTAASITIPMAGGPYDGSQNSNGWVPSGVQSSPLVYQGSLAMPDLCSGGTMVVGEKMGPFTADVYSTNFTDSINVRWHYGPAGDLSSNGGTGSSWSATKSVVPADISGASQADVLGRWGPVGVGGVFLAGAVGGVLVWRQRRRHQVVPVEK
jgi:hypothetical protein